MANFLKKITDANFLPGKRARGNNHYVYSSIFNSLMDKLIPIVTDKKEVTVEKLKYEALSEETVVGGYITVKKRAGRATLAMTTAAGGYEQFRVYLEDEAGNPVTLPSDAMIYAVVESYSGNGIPIVGTCSRSVSTFFVVEIRNVHASAAFNNDAIINYFMINV